MNLMVLQLALICSAGVGLSKPECVNACLRVELCFFLHVEREQRRLLGYSGDRHLGRQHNGLARVSVSMRQVHTRLILQHVVSYDRLGNWSFLPQTSSPDSYFLRIRCFWWNQIQSHSIPHMMKRLSTLPTLQSYSTELRAYILRSSFLSHLLFFFFKTQKKKPSMKGGKVAMVTASQQLQWVVATLALLGAQ